MKKANFILAILGIILAVVLVTGATKAMGHMMAESMDNAMDSIFGVTTSSFEKEGRW